MKHISLAQYGCNCGALGKVQNYTLQDPGTLQEMGSPLPY